MTFPFVDSPPENAQYFTIHKEKTATFKTICQGPKGKMKRVGTAINRKPQQRRASTEILIILPKTVELVKEWYRSDEISCVMPGMKYFISVKIEDRRMQVQKRLILCNL